MRGVSGRKDEAGLFTDKLGERLAGEILLVGLLDALAHRCENESLGIPGGTIDVVREQKLAHVRLLERGIRILGANAAVRTPGARRLEQSSEGLQRVVRGRGNSADSLHAVLFAQLREELGWEALVAPAERFFGALGWEFRGALLEEREHSRALRDWLGGSEASAS